MSWLVMALLQSAPVIIKRSEWDPTPPKRCCASYDQPIKKVLKWIVVHHSDFTDAPGPLAIKEYHLQVSGFSDIGYHFVIAADGTIYEGRSLQLMGSHAGITVEGKKDRHKDPDYGSIGVVLDGQYSQADPTPQQIQALFSLVPHLRKRFHIRADHVIGHRDVKPVLDDARGLTFVGELKDCPGEGGMKLVEILRHAE